VVVSTPRLGCGQPFFTPDIQRRCLLPSGVGDWGFMSKRDELTPGPSGHPCADQGRRWALRRQTPLPIWSGWQLRYRVNPTTRPARKDNTRQMCGLGDRFDRRS
jgi:hypothetical protein